MSALAEKCRYQNCRKTLKTLRDLIIHIENDHLDFSPEVQKDLEAAQPQYIPMSYVLRFGKTGDVAEEVEPVISEDTPIILETIPNGALATSYSNNPPLYRRLKQISASNADKPFACPVPGCDKKYKNINGIKYHYINHHNKPFKNCKSDMATKSKYSTKRIKGQQKIKSNSFDLNQNMNQLEDINLHSYAMPSYTNQVQPIPKLSFFEDKQTGQECWIAR